ncbi:tRNA (adenosine(37)-N6)-dimethylallyltransferase MiaA [Leptolyngbya sp. BC1307]|uniref:tRNA (adenosine(37)-N6)-dimethylallyltransferase MiaA n=1 Tax=Leptolyngbya sp. BC1307 TaxID=2029589 RepID=UPI003204D89B
MIVVGPTAVGKSGLAMALAHQWPAAILSADSRQVYREFDIGTAKPSLQDRQQVPHYFVDVCDPTETLTVAGYQQQAQGVIAQMHQRGDRLPLLVGGTGLYVDAIAKGLKIPRVPPDLGLRSQLTNLGQSHCHALLHQVDPVASDRIHPNDSVRTLRALEVYYVTGQTISSQQGEDPPSYPVLYIGLSCEPDVLRSRIVTRTRQMVAAGLVDEVAWLIEKYGSALPLLKTLGYAELQQHLAGDISLDAAIEQIVQHTCQFAKRQRTWFRKDPRIEWFAADGPALKEQVLQRVDQFVQSTAASGL